MSVTSSRTNGFPFADLRDYTRYVESHGDQAAAALLEAYRSLVRAAVPEHGGAEIMTEGDSFYVVFPSTAGPLGAMRQPRGVSELPDRVARDPRMWESRANGAGDLTPRLRAPE
jgi:class 3 adenylate cyclase